MKKIKKGLNETKTAAGLELKYVAAKKTGYKHGQELEEQLNVLKIQREEIPTLRERVTSISNHTKELAESEAKGAAEFSKESDSTNQHPKLSQYYKSVSHNFKETSAARFKLRASIEEVKEEWKNLETAELHELRVKQDQTNRSSTDAAYWHGQKKPQKAAEFEAKYKVLTTELVTLIHECRMKKEERVPGYLLRFAQAQAAFYREALRNAEQLEASLRDIGSVTPVPFYGLEKFKQEIGGSHHGDDSSSGSPPGQSHMSGHGHGHSAHAHHSSTPPNQSYMGHAAPHGHTGTPPNQSYMGAPAPQVRAPSPTRHAPQQHYAPQPQYGGGGHQYHAPPPIPSYPKAQGLYPFTAEQPNELSFNAGDMLTILSQEGQWWTAQLNGKTGSIPANYVKLI